MARRHLRFSAPGRHALATALLAAALAAAAPSRAQDLVGCQLIEGQLSCVPGVSADPQSQIKALRQQIAGTEALEGAVEQGIEGLESLVLRGEAAEGQLLMAAVSSEAAADGLAGVPDQAFHWYRLSPGSSQWLLIPDASGPRYQLQASDVGALVMVMVSLPGEGTVGTVTGSRRQASPMVGPVKP
ncbi:conserved hypothetical protein [Cyanobium sp. PCC 7001]|uniref:hypothetical protein n=1 Tax=Cyanobium sp. PCC 7001 TaxID=180281 RepID=UPI0001805401|nr:hypothetical protein [Cyanobium sp. PCC 7001]EDY39162.1 conserved hypothetical protein [Cyanobium sp. PCC 7001]